MSLFVAVWLVVFSFASFWSVRTRLQLRSIAHRLLWLRDPTTDSRLFVEERGLIARVFLFGWTR